MRLPLKSDCESGGVSILGAAVLCVLATPVEAQTSSASVYHCEPGPSCAVGGSCKGIDYGLEYIHIWDASTPRFFVSGPILKESGAGSGSFFEEDVRQIDVADQAAVLAMEWEADAYEFLLASYSDEDMERGTGGQRLYVVRPGRQVPRLRGETVVTEFLCRQVLY